MSKTCRCLFNRNLKYGFKDLDLYPELFTQGRSSQPARRSGGTPGTAWSACPGGSKYFWVRSLPLAGFSGNPKRKKHPCGVPVRGSGKKEVEFWVGSLNLETNPFLGSCPNLETNPFVGGLLKFGDKLHFLCVPRFPNQTHMRLSTEYVLEDA